MSEIVISAKHCVGTVLKRMEKETGTRYCRDCDRLLPLDKFDLTLKNTRFLCKMHTKAAYHAWGYGTDERRAFSTFKAKLQADRKLFDQDRVEIKKTDMVKIVKPEHISHASEWCIIPRKPDIPISGDNMVMATIYVRRCLIKRWRENKDPQQYTALLEHMLEHGVSPTPGTKK